MADLLKCKNCGGELALSSDHSYYECKYCEARFPVEKKETPEKSVDTSKNTQEQPETVEKPQPQLSIVQKHFNLVAQTLNSDASMESWTELCKDLNADSSFETYGEFFENYAANHSCSANPKNQEYLFKKAYARMASLMSSDEKFIIWVDDGLLIQNAKEGVAFTDKAIYFMQKKFVYKLLFKDIQSITQRGPYNTWQFNNKDGYDIHSYHTTNTQMGIFLAYACKNAIDSNSDDYKIDLFCKDW